MTKTEKTALIASLVDISGLLLSIAGSGYYFFVPETGWVKTLARIVFALSCLVLLIFAFLGSFYIEKRLAEMKDGETK